MDKPNELESVKESTTAARTVCSCSASRALLCAVRAALLVCYPLLLSQRNCLSSFSSWQEGTPWARQKQVTPDTLLDRSTREVHTVQQQALCTCCGIHLLGYPCCAVFVSVNSALPSLALPCPCTGGGCSTRAQDTLCSMALPRSMRSTRCPPNTLSTCCAAGGIFYLLLVCLLMSLAHPVHCATLPCAGGW